MDTSFFDSDYFIVGYYILTVGASLLLIRDTKKRIRNLKIGRNSIKYAPISFGILFVYVLFVFPYVDEIPILNWSWLGYNIAFGPFAEEVCGEFYHSCRCCYTCFYISTISRSVILENQKRW